MKIKLLLALLPVAALMQCNDDDNFTYTLLSDFEITEDQLITVESEKQNDYLEVSILEITDSRCPINANCVRFGEAEVKVSVTGIEEIAKTVELCIGDCFQRNQGFIEEDTVEVELDSKRYAVILSEVTPYPSFENQDDPKTAVLKLVRLN